MADIIDFGDLKQKCDARAEEYNDRNTLFDKMEKIFLLNWDEEKPSQQWMKYSVSPDGRNAILGAMRLLIASDPKISVPFDKANQSQQDTAEMLEKASGIILRTIGKVRQMPLHYDIARSALLFGSVDMGIQMTSLLSQTKRAKESKAAKLRFERLEKTTPWMVEVYDPRTCYQEYDAYGLRSFYRKRDAKVSELRDLYGDMVEGQLASAEDTDEKALCEYWDDIVHGVWIEGESSPILLEEHKLACIPIVSQTIEGSMLHSAVESRIQPFLYSLEQTGLWERENLVLTILYSNLFYLASNPQLKFSTADESSKGPDVDWTTPGGMTILRNGESLEPLQVNAIDPALLQGLEIAENKLTESTMYRQTLGEPLGGNAPYSMVSLLNQAGRLPLVPYQRLCGNAISNMLEKGFSLLKEGGKKTTLQGKDAVVELKTSDIPAHLIIDCTLDIALPQDDRQNATVAQQVTEAGLASKRWARENYMQIEQSKEMEKEIWKERAEDLQLQMTFQQEQAQAQQQMQMQQAQMQAQMQQGMPQQGMPPEMQGMPPEGMQGLPPEQMAQNPQAATQGMPMTEPMQESGEMPL